MSSSSFGVTFRIKKTQPKCMDSLGWQETTSSRWERQNLLKILEGNVVGVWCTSSPPYANGLHPFCLLKWSSSKSTNPTPILSHSHQANPIVEVTPRCPTRACSISKVYLFSSSPCTKITCQHPIFLQLSFHSRCFQKLPYCKSSVMFSLHLSSRPQPYDLHC
jgi:hypothetical protein